MILDEIKTSKRYLGKSEMTSGNKYEVRITYKNKTIYEVFNDNYENKSDKKEFIYALLSDADAYNNARNLADFILEYGYEEDEKEAKRVYNACKRQAEKIEKLFTKDEQEELKEIFENY